MKIVIKTPEQILKEQAELLKRAIMLMEKYEKYNEKARKKMQWTMYQIHKLEKLLPQ